MGLSGSRDFIYTRDDIIAAALRKLKVIVQGGTPTANQYSYAGEALNVMQSDWQNDGVLLWTNTDLHLALVADTAYITASSNPDVVEIGNVIYREDETDTTLTRISQAEYQSITQKAESGTPTHYWIEYLLASTKMWLFPVYSHTTGAVTGSDASVYLCTNDHESASATYPTTGASYANDWVVTTQISTGGAWVTATNYYSGHIRCTKTQRLQDFDASANNPDFHVRAYNALVMGLAASLAPEYLTINEAKFWIVLAKEAKERFMLSQTEHGPIYVKPRFK